MNTKVEEALKVLDEQHDDYLQAGEYSGEGCWFGNNFAADYAKEYAAARTTLSQHIAQQDATIARLTAAGINARLALAHASTESSVYLSAYKDLDAALKGEAK